MEIEKGELYNGINAAVLFAKGGNRYLECVFFECKDERLNIVGTNGKCLSVLSAPCSGQDIEFAISLDDAKKILKAIDISPDDKIEIQVNESIVKVLGFSFDALDVSIPSWREVMPEYNDTPVKERGLNPFFIQDAIKAFQLKRSMFNGREVPSFHVYADSALSPIKILCRAISNLTLVIMPIKI